MRLKHSMQRSSKRVWTKSNRFIREFRIHSFGIHTNWRKWKYNTNENSSEE